MKKFLLLLLCAGSMSAQQGKQVARQILDLQKRQTTFVTQPLFSEGRHLDQPATLPGVTKATLATVDIISATAIAVNSPEHIRIQIPYNNSLLSLLLYKVEISSTGFHVDTDKANNVQYEKGAHYRGIVESDPHSLVSFNFFRNEVNGIISAPNIGNVVVGKLTSPGNMTDYIIYAEKNLTKLPGFTCHSTDTKGFDETAVDLNRASPTTDRCVTTYFELDFDLYEANNSDLTQTINWLTSVFNNVQTLYDNDDLNIAIKSLYVWTTPDPYTGEFSWEYMQQFYEMRPIFDGDVGQLLGIDSGLGGVAVGINGLCTESNYSYSDVFFDHQTVPVYSWTVMVIAHELGHLLGSQHTHGCWWNGNNSAIDGCATTVNIQYAEGECLIEDIPAPEVGGTIMSYCHLLGEIGINFANGFGPQPAARIANRINNATCLGSDCITTCINQIAGINVSNITNSGALININDESDASSWEVSIDPFPFTTSNWTTITQPFLTASDLEPNSYYKISVRPSCPGLEGVIKSAMFATNANYCEGILFTDSGSSAANYNNSETWVRTMIPSPGNAIKVTFTSFNIEQDYDYLIIYDGPEMTGESFLTALTGNMDPGSFVSTHPSGALTFSFSSDRFLTAPGWTANVSCNSLGLTDELLVDFSYYPNPTSNLVHINAKNQIREVKVFGIDGRLLISNTLNENTAKVDISSLASGTYVFKLRFDNADASFKIIKN